MASTCSGVILPEAVIGVHGARDVGAGTASTKAVVLARCSVVGRESSIPWEASVRMTTCSASDLGWYSGCLSISIRALPCSSWRRGLGVQIRAELGERLHILVLGQLDAEVGVGFLHGLGLCRAAHTGDGQADIDSRAVACVEQGALEEDLAIGDGDDVGGDVSGDIACLGLDDGQGGDGTAAQVIPHPAGALQQTGVQIEDIAGVSLTAGGAPQQQGDGTVGHRVLGKVIVNDEDALALMP